jgi:hypothetical protein
MDGLFRPMNVRSLTATGVPLIWLIPSLSRRPGTENGRPAQSTIHR